MTNPTLSNFVLEPLPLEHVARLFWASGMHGCQTSWEQVAAWCFGAYSVAERSSDRELWHFLGAIAWDHAGMRRDSLDEVAA